MKKYILFISFLFPPLILSAQNLNDSLLLYYLFQGNANDSSGNNLQGVIVNAVPTSDRSDSPNSAYYFNGINSYIELPNSSILKPQLPVSFAFWVKFDDLTASNSQIFITDYTENTYNGIWFGLNPNTYEMQISYGSGIPDCTSPNCRRTKQGNTPLDTSKWYFVAGVIRGAEDMDIYIDCKNDSGKYTGTGGDIAYSSNPGSLGRTDQAILNPYYFKGKLDEFRYWNRALNESDISQLNCLIDSRDDYASNFVNPISLYPNPNYGVLNFKEQSLINHFAQIKIFNAMGQLKYFQNNVIIDKELSSLNLNDLPEGAYFFQLSGENFIYSKSFVIFK